MSILGPTLRTALALTCSLALVACGGSSGDEEQARSGEVLEGTISDEMLPIDTVRSQPPLADPEAAAATRAPAASTGVRPADSAMDANSPAAGEATEGAGEQPEGEAAEPEPAAGAGAED